MLTFSGNFTDLLSCVGNYKSNAAQWAAHPDLNGTNTGKRCIPVIGFPSATLSGDMTFTSIATGSNDGLIARLITVWAEKGFKTLIVRWGYEDNYPTTPGGVDAYPGSNFEKTYNWPPDYDTLESIRRRRLGVLRRFHKGISASLSCHARSSHPGGRDSPRGLGSDVDQFLPF